MAWNDLIDTVAKAATDGARAERLYKDESFRAELRETPELALRQFELVTPTPPRLILRRRDVRALLRVEVEAGRSRPIL